MNRKISIITISYNSESTIEKTILSVINQRYDNLEYIIIDGNSKDNTINIINKYKKNISIFKSEPDKGISDAFNKGIKLATGEIIGLINSDDVLNKDALINLNKFINENPDYDVYYGNTINFNNEIQYVYKPRNDIKQLEYNMILSHPSTFIKKETYEKFGLYNLEYKLAMDFELLSKIYKNNGKFKYIDYEFVWFKLDGCSKKQTKKTCLESEKIAINNGVNENIVKKFYRKIYIKEKLVNIIRKLHLEIFFRKIINNQEKYNGRLDWYNE